MHAGPDGRVLVYYSEDYAVAEAAFDTTRKAGWVADSLAAAPIPRIVLVAPEPVTVAQLMQVHDPSYVEAVRTGEPAHLAESNGFSWDPGLFRMVCASTGGAVEAARRAIAVKGVAGSLSSGLHHARRGLGAGFCTFNGLALAARAALADGARSVLMIDLDAHCGGGTAELLGGDERIVSLDIAVSAYDRYDPPAGWTLDVVADASDYLPTLVRRLETLDAEAFDLVIYNAGMDPYEQCAVGGLHGMTAEVLAERERTVFAWCSAAALPVAFVLAGGYENTRFTRQELVALHRLTLAAAVAQSS
jgi:acetoin utilization deacetylase AcuC-like enzyme